MSDLSKRLGKDMEDEKFRKLWEDMEPEFQIIKMIINTRHEKGLTQKQLADLAGIEQASLSRIETGKVSPDLVTIKKIATAMGKKLELSFTASNRK